MTNSDSIQGEIQFAFSFCKIEVAFEKLDIEDNKLYSTKHFFDVER